MPNPIFLASSPGSLPVFSISVEMSFQASHQLALPDGSKEPTHTHNWSVTAQVAAKELDDMGVVMDFHELRAQLAAIIAPFENTQLDALDYFGQNNPSAENVAKYIYEKIGVKLPQHVNIKSVKVGEEQGCRAEYTE